MGSFDNKKHLDRVWLKASVAGSLWASFEIIAGSVLHNLHIPFAGSVLTAFAIILLISFTQIWPERGLILKAGLICALMKSISPSAVILGPMIGILSEALIIEVVIFLFGRNIIVFIAAGSFAMLSSLAHKIINLIILYGFNLLDIYANLYNYAARQFSNSDHSPENLLYLLIFIYLLIGSSSAFSGYLIGRKAVRTERKVKIYPLSNALSNSSLIQKKFNISLLIAHFIYVPVVLYLFSYYNNLILNASLTSIYFLGCIYYYQNIAGKLLKPFLWFQFLVIFILASLFLESSSPGHYSLIRGLKGGFEMLIRAVFIITAFSAISIELLNPSIRNFLVKKGFNKLYASLQLSFNALPEMIQNMKGNLKWLKNPLKSIAGMVNDAENWLESFKNNTDL